MTRLQRGGSLSAKEGTKDSRICARPQSMQVLRLQGRKMGILSDLVWTPQVSRVWRSRPRTGAEQLFACFSDTHAG